MQSVERSPDSGSNRREAVEPASSRVLGDTLEMAQQVRPEGSAEVAKAADDDAREPLQNGAAAPSTAQNGTGASTAGLAGFGVNAGWWRR